MADKQIHFGKVVRTGYQISRKVARDRAYYYANRFADNWRNRFNNDDLIAGPDGQPGSAEPLRERTIAARVERGYYGRGMLFDPSLPHVVEEGLGTIKASIERGDLQEREQGFYTELFYTVTTDHFAFPINEFGIGVPQRMTLFPTEQEVATKFTRDLHRGYKKALNMKHEKP